MWLLCFAFLLLALPQNSPPADDDLLAGLRPGHPRLLLTAEAQARLETLAETDTLLAGLIAETVRRADQALDASTVEYQLIGPRLLTQSRRALEKVLTLSLAHRLTNEERYKTRAVAELRAAAAFPDWNPSHFLDVAEMTTAFALGYDWLYEALTPDERSMIKAALIDHGLQPGLEAYADSAWWMAENPNNWNQVCNAGLSLGALALADEEPDLARWILAPARATIPNGMAVYGPDGQYIEGPSYWDYGTTYNALLIDALQSALETDWGLSAADGFSDTGAFRMHTVTPTGAYYNYADAGRGARPSPTLFWLADQFDRPDYAAFHRAWVADLMAEQRRAPERDLFGNRFFGLEVVWYQPAQDRPAGERPTEALFRSVGDVVAMRSAWDDERALYVGFKGGANQASHAHQDIGSFILEADGVRWAVDLGRDDYNLPGYWDEQEGGTRWDYYRLNSKSHNTLVVGDRLQRAEATAKAVTYAEAPDRVHAVMDLSEAYAGQAERVRRGVAMLDRSRVLIQDELTLADDTTAVRWGMVTEATVDLHGSTATLRQDGRTLRARILEPDGARFTTVSTDPDDERQEANDGTTMLAVFTKPDADHRVRLVVLLTPVGERWPEEAIPAMEPLQAWDGPLGTRRNDGWPEGFERIEIPNPTDGHPQPTYARASTQTTPQPLIVVLHSWSADYRQRDGSLAEEVAARDWHYLHPDFRGRNVRPEACCSELALEDLDAAIAYALEHWTVDASNIHVVGSSGGGYATLCMFMKSRHPIASFSAWVPISDLPAWYEQSKARDSKYHREILQCTASGDTLDVAAARRRSPMFMPTPVEKLDDSVLNLYAGARDGVTGSVPITQSLLFYNKVMDDLGVDDPAARVAADDIIHLLSTYTAPRPAGDRLGDREVVYRQAHGNVRVTIFDGGHEMLSDVALDLLPVRR